MFTKREALAMDPDPTKTYGSGRTQIRRSNTNERAVMFTKGEAPAMDR